ncbi:MAG: hypothetical protein LBP35_03940 [Candidatus Ancillula trichonymphae]|nr:hypothetical protein [Candidatus Ancillula trichonymphae]
MFNDSLNDELKKVLAGKAFDNGLVCACEQSIIAPEAELNRYRTALKELDAEIINDAGTLKQMEDVLFSGGSISKDAVGQDAQKLAQMTGLAISSTCRVLVVEPKTWGQGQVWSKEKMFPVLAFYGYATWEQAIEIARENLQVEGIGHSVSVHSFNSDRILEVGLKLPVSRVLVNQNSATNAGGTMFNGPNPTTTLGCGT